MRRNNAEQVGDVIRFFLRQQGLESPLNEYRLVQAWSDVVGPAMARYTSNLYIKNQTLHVHLTSAVLRQELMMVRASGFAERVMSAQTVALRAMQSLW